MLKFWHATGLFTTARVSSNLKIKTSDVLLVTEKPVVTKEEYRPAGTKTIRHYYLAYINNKPYWLESSHIDYKECTLESVDQNPFQQYTFHKFESEILEYVITEFRWYLAKDTRYIATEINSTDVKMNKLRYYQRSYYELWPRMNHKARAWEWVEYYITEVSKEFPFDQNSTKKNEEYVKVLKHDHAAKFLIKNNRIPWLDIPLTHIP